MTKRKLILEDGTTFMGEAFGSNQSTQGELISNTGMTGYQEMMTNPSYFGKIAVMTYPTIGAYGVNRDDFESIMPTLNGMIVKEACQEPSNFRSEETIAAYMEKYNIPGISGVDTRKLTRHLRKKGSMRAFIADEADEVTDTSFVSSKTAEEWIQKASIVKPYIVPGRGKRIVLIDLGMSQSILHELTEKGCHITVVPYDYSNEDVQAYKPDGILLSNGPGNPDKAVKTIRAVQTLLGKYPIFGIGLGHQIMALAYGAKTKKLHIGNYGVSFPVKEIQTDRTWITTQSRSYYVDENSLKGTGLEITHRSLNDYTIEGLSHVRDNAFSVQFHPQGAPGTNETNGLFDQFIQNMESNAAQNGGQTHA
ncbi:MAG TPA: carbamoyl phosphate synthase small subunit [Pseudogracilibacillus sp.]|nr:carbamoyl phosphate synthase small subunit [Pseudogracilibacillus sp.]